MNTNTKLLFVIAGLSEIFLELSTSGMNAEAMNSSENNFQQKLKDVTNTLITFYRGNDKEALLYNLKNKLAELQIGYDNKTDDTKEQIKALQKRVNDAEMAVECLPFKNKWQIKIDSIMIVGKYFKNNNDFINTMKICKNYKELVLMYKFNPIPDISLFENIQTQHFYNMEDVKNKKEGLYQYIYWFPQCIKDEFYYNRDENNEFFKRFIAEAPEEKYEDLSHNYEILPSDSWLFTNGQTQHLWRKEDKKIEGKRLYVYWYLRSYFDCRKSCENTVFKNIELNNYECRNRYCVDADKKLFEERFFVPFGVTRIGNSCFEKSDQGFQSVLTDVVFETNVLREIGDRAFARTKIFSIIIPNGVTKIGNACFHHCDLLRNVILPSTVKMIGEYAFDYTKVYEIAVCEGCKYGGKVENDTKSGKELRDGDKILIDDEKGTLTVCVLNEEKLNQYNENKKSMRSEKKTEPVQRDEMSDDAFNDYDVSVSDNDIIYYSDEGENSDSETINE